MRRHHQVVWGDSLIAHRELSPASVGQSLEGQHCRQPVSTQQLQVTAKHGKSQKGRLHGEEGDCVSCVHQLGSSADLEHHKVMVADEGSQTQRHVAQVLVWRQAGWQLDTHL